MTPASFVVAEYFRGVSNFRGGVDCDKFLYWYVYNGGTCAYLAIFIVAGLLP